MRRSVGYLADDVYRLVGDVYRLLASLITIVLTVETTSGNLHVVITPVCHKNVVLEKYTCFGLFFAF